MSRKFDDGPENFAARLRSLQQNTTFEDRQRNVPIFYDRLFDLRSKGTVKRIWLGLWAMLLLCFALSTCVSAWSNGSAGLAFAISLFIGFPALAASLAAVWTALFLRGPARRSYLRRPDGRP